MIAIEDLVSGDGGPLPLRAMEADPLRKIDALREAQLLDVRVSPLTAVVGLLFELRTSLQFDVGNAAVLVVRGVSSFEWNSSAARLSLTAFSIVSSVPELSGNSFRFRFGCYPEARIAVQGSSAEFHVVDVAGISDVPPDYSGGDLRGVQDALPSWSSACNLLQSSNT